MLIAFCLLLISFAYLNIGMRNFFSIDNNVKFEVIPYIGIRQTYLQMIGYTKKKSSFELAITEKQLANSKK